jgi:phosphoglycolate phosphatase-like HAD superfamily hydrolase
VSPGEPGLAIDLDALGDTQSLWQAWLADAAKVLDVDTGTLPEDRSAAAARLDEAGAGNWRTLLGRFAEDHAPVYLRPSADATAALRDLVSGGERLGLFTDAPRELALIAAAHLGASRRVEAIEAGPGAVDRLAARFGGNPVIISTRAELLDAARAGR